MQDISHIQRGLQFVRYVRRLPQPDLVRVYQHDCCNSLSRARKRMRLQAHTCPRIKSITSTPVGNVAVEVYLSTIWFDFELLATEVAGFYEIRPRRNCRGYKSRYWKWYFPIGRVLHRECIVNYPQICETVTVSQKEMGRDSEADAQDLVDSGHHVFKKDYSSIRSAL